ncbi:VCBS repeat-containing protein [Candidatus Woesearchaeota archaeon]|nr:VCBS repeat-containing protein [Candidatus Woesearchaeota archaeon]
MHDDENHVRQAINTLLLVFLALYATTAIISTHTLTGKAAHTHYPDTFSAMHDITINQQEITAKDTVIHKQGWYSINGADWQSITLTGNTYQGSTAWLANTATATLPDTILQAGEHYLILYTCTYNNGWDCHGDKWQLGIITNNPDTPILPQGAELLAAGFEQGLATPFLTGYGATLTIDTVRAHSGQNSLRLTGTTDHGWTQPCTGSKAAIVDFTTQGKEFTLGAYARSDKDTPGSITILCYGDDYLYYGHGDEGWGATEFTATTDWQHITVTHTCPDWATSAGIRIEVHEQGSSIWYDDAYLITTPAREGVIAHWPLDGDAHDAAGTHDGSVTGATFTTDAHAGQAASFDGNGDRIEIPSFSISGDELTIAAWFKAADLANCPDSDCRIISKATGIQEEDHEWMISTWYESGTTRLRFRLKTNGDTGTLITSPVSNNEWVHVTAVYDGQYMRLYKNGAETGKLAKTGTITTSGAQVWIGDNPPIVNSKPWDGIIDDVIIFDRALTASEVQQLYQGGGTCTPTTCAALGYDCGTWSDGCSSTLNCGSCDGTCNNGHCETAQPVEGLLARYTFDSVSGTSVPDVAGSNDGTLYGGTITQGVLELDGNNDHVSIGTMNIPGEQMTIAAWARTRDVNNCGTYQDCRIVSKATGTAEQDHYWMVGTWNENGPKLRFRLKAGGTTSTLVASSGNIINDDWFHVAAVYDGQYMRLYKDGAQVGSTAKTGTITSSTAAAWIGDNPPTTGSRPWDGYLDDVRIYDTALSQAEVQDIYGMGEPQGDFGGGSTSCQSNPGELLVLDETFTIPSSTDSAHGGNGFWWWKTIPAGWPSNWRTPYDYYDGRFYTRYEVLSQPTNNQGDISFVMWQKDIDNDGDMSEDVESRITFAGPGVSVHDTSPHDWWKHTTYGGVDWTQIGQLDRYGFATWKTNPFCQLSTWGTGCPEYQYQYFPLEIRATIVAVPEGGTFSGWDCWLGGGGAVSTDFDFTHHYITSNLITETGNGVQTASDYDNDGDLDFTIGSRYSPTGMYWYENDGSGEWTRRTIASTIPSNSLGAADYDVDGDGWEDIISAGVWYENDRDGTFTERRYDPNMQYYHEFHDVTMADMNNDGVLDVIGWSANYGSYWYDFTTNLRGTWTRHDVEPNLPAWKSQGNELHAAVSPIGIGDLDGDGDNDVWGTVAWYENRNNGASFTRHTEDHTGVLFTGSLPYGKATRSFIIDIDNDGDDDIVFTECDDVDSRGGILKNNGNGDFTLELLPKTLIGRRGSLHSLFVGDLNMDGSLEIVTAEQEDLNVGSTAWYVWTNTGSGWEEHLLFDIGLGGHDSIFKDVDQDGDIDIISKVWNPEAGHNILGGVAHADYYENQAITQPSAGIRLSSNINNGWTQRGGAYWETRGDMIVARQQGGNGGELISTQSFSDYEVVFDAWPDYSVDTGLYVRATDDGKGYQVTIDYQPNNPIGGIWLSGIGDTGVWDFEIKDEDEIQPSRWGDTPAFDMDAWSYIWKEHDWNQFRVRVEGNPVKITTWINGWKVHEYQDTQTRLSSTGKIALQVHDGADDYLWADGAVARFRNIKVYPR